MTLDTRIQPVILRQLLSDTDYATRFLPYLKPDHFDDRNERNVFVEIRDYLDKYKTVPTIQNLTVGLSNRKGLNQEQYDGTLEYIKMNLTGQNACQSTQWLYDQTTRHMQTMERQCGMMDLLEANTSNRPTAAAIKRVQQADVYSVNESMGIGLDWEPLFEALQSPDEKFPFKIDILNEMTCGGPSRKTLTVIVAPTNTGKSLVLCHQAAEYLRQERNVLYVTLEMADRKIQKRIFANVLDTDMNALDKWTRDQWRDAMDQLGTIGKLKVREYASRSAHAGTFRQFLDDVKAKEGFVPDVIMIDYLNECVSQTMQHSKNVGMYQYMGSIASELRALATDYNAVVWTATQTNRDGYDGDPELKNTSESAQINSGADLIIGINKDEKFPDNLRFRVLKNRDAEKKDKVFMIGVNRSKMKLFDINDPFAVAQSVVAKQQQIKQTRNTAKPSFLK